VVFQRPTPLPTLPLKGRAIAYELFKQFQPFGLSLSKPFPSLRQKEMRSFDRLRTNGKGWPNPICDSPALKGEAFNG